MESELAEAFAAMLVLYDQWRKQELALEKFYREEVAPAMVIAIKCADDLSADEVTRALYTACELSGLADDDEIIQIVRVAVPEAREARRKQDLSLNAPWN